MASSPQEADLRVLISDDRTKADLLIPKDYSRELLTEPMCRAVLDGANVEVTSAVLEAVGALIKQAMEADDDVRQTVAQHTPVEHGEDGRIEWTIDQQQEDHDEGDTEGTGNDTEGTGGTGGTGEAEGSKENYYENSAFITVDTGQVVAKIIEPTLGQDGRDVLGKTIDAIRGKSIALKFDESLMRDAKGNLIAQDDGVLIRKDGMAAVRRVIEIAEYVDFSTGNIDFTGDVIIRKGVRDCFVIRADGNVEVQGLIEAATINCGGDLIAKGGFAGRERGEATVGGNLLGKYLDNINGQIEGDLTIDREVINCDFMITGCIRSPRGSIIGGKHVVTGAVEIGTLGSPADVPTELVIGTVPKLDPFIGKLEAIVEMLTEQHQKLIDEQNLINKNTRRLTAQDKERQTEIMFDLQTTSTSMSRGQIVLDGLLRRVESQRTIDLYVIKLLHAGVVLQVHDRIFKVHTDVKGPIQIKLEKGECIYRPDSGGGGLLSQIAQSKAA